MTDETETIRRAMLANGDPQRDLFEVAMNKGQAWDIAALGRDFTVHGFMAPFVVVTRKSDGKKGSMEFTHSPRWYFNFVVD